MSPLRLPQHLTDQAHGDSGEAHLRFDLLEHVDGAVVHAEAAVESALLALRKHDDAEGPTEDRGRLLEAAVEAVWNLIVQHEAGDCFDHRELVTRYGVPAEVMAQIGIGTPDGDA